VKGILIRRYFWCFVTLSKLITWLFGNPSAADKRSVDPIDRSPSPRHHPIGRQPLTARLYLRTPLYCRKHHPFLFFTVVSRHSNAVRTRTHMCRLSLSVTLCPCQCLISRIELFFIWKYYLQHIHTRSVLYYYKTEHFFGFALCPPYWKIIETTTSFDLTIIL